MRSERVRVVLDESAHEDQLTALAGRYDWWMKSRIGRNGDQPEEYVYSTDDGATDLHFIQDHKIGVTYILVAGPAAGEVVPLLRESLDHYDPDEILEGAKNEMGAGDRRRSLYYLALVTMDRGFDREVFEIYRKALADPDPYVRGSAVLGAAYLGWPELAEPIGALARPEEPDETIRRDAGLLAERLAAFPKPF
jgi:hypothetical protein